MNTKKTEPSGRKKIQTLMTAVMMAILAYGVINHMIFAWARQQLSELLTGSAREVSSLQVKISGTSLPRLLMGYVEQVDIHAQEVEIENFPRISSLSFTARGLRGTRQQITSVDTTKALIILKEEDINRFIRQRAELHPPFPQLDISRENVRVRIRMPFIRGASPLSVEGRFKVDQGARLEFLPDGVDFFGNPIPGEVTDILSHRVNPLLDFTDLNPRAVIEDFTTGDKYIRVFGRIELHEPIIFR